MSTKVCFIIYTIYVHCRKIYNLFAQAIETGRKASLLYLTTMYVYCVYPAMPVTVEDKKFN